MGLDENLRSWGNPDFVIFQYQTSIQRLVNILIEHHPTIGDMISNRYLKVMFKIPKKEHLPTHAICEQNSTSRDQTPVTKTECPWRFSQCACVLLDTRQGAVDKQLLLLHPAGR